MKRVRVRRKIAPPIAPGRWPTYVTAKAATNFGSGNQTSHAAFEAFPPVV